MLNMAIQEKQSQCPFLSPKNRNILSLSERINISTRGTHTQLNRLIIARLPLALPPHNPTPSLYISGLYYITPVYITFESRWQKVVDALHYTSKEGTQICSVLSNLLLSNILRSERLRGDIRKLSGLTEEEVEAQLRETSKNGIISEFVTHMTRSSDTKPHILLAYIWVFYMALFSGGRYIRATLQDAGVEFWTRSQSSVHSCFHQEPQNNAHYPSSLSSDEQITVESQIPLRRRSSRSGNLSHKVVNQGLQFFHFLGEEDGEDIKRELKKRFAESEAFLSPKEKEEIVQEAQNICKFMIEMVGELDQVCGSVDQTSVQNATMTAQRNVYTEGRRFSKSRNLESGKHDSFSSFIQGAWRVNQLIDVLSAGPFQAIRSQLSKTGLWKIDEQNMKDVGMDSTFTLFIVLLTSIIIVYCISMISD